VPPMDYDNCEVEVSIGKKYLGTEAQKSFHRFLAGGVESRRRVPQLRGMLQADHVESALPDLSVAASCMSQVPTRRGGAGLPPVRVSLPIGGRFFAVPWSRRYL
jgi:hypothetical protein